MFVLAIVGIGAQLERALTFDGPAMPLGRLLPAMGQVTGVELKAAPNVARDVALVRVAGKPLGIELYASGFSDLQMKLTVRKDEPLFCDSTPNPAAKRWGRILNADNVGRTMVETDGPGFDRFGIAQRTTYVLFLSARKGISAGASLEDVTPPQEPLKPLSEMPANVRVAVETARARAEAQKTPEGERVTP